MSKKQSQTTPVAEPAESTRRLRRSPHARELRDAYALETVLKRVLGVGEIDAKSRAEALQEKRSEILDAYRNNKMDDLHNLLSIEPTKKGEKKTEGKDSKPKTERKPRGKKNAEPPKVADSKPASSGAVAEPEVEVKPDGAVATDAVQVEPSADVKAE